eukprot:gene16788-5165_t
MTGHAVDSEIPVHVHLTVPVHVKRTCMCVILHVRVYVHVRDSVRNVHVNGNSLVTISHNPHMHIYPFTVRISTAQVSGVSLTTSVLKSIKSVLEANTRERVAFSRFVTRQKSEFTPRVSETLLRFHGDPNLTDAMGLTPLHEAARLGHEKMAKLLTSHGSKMDASMEVTIRNPGTIEATMFQRLCVKTGFGNSFRNSQNLLESTPAF